MVIEKLMKIIFYTTSSAQSPVTAFIDKQPQKDQGKLWEIKIKAPSGGYRFLYGMVSKEDLIILHGFKKKTQKTPLKEIRIALKRLKEYL